MNAANPITGTHCPYVGKFRGIGVQGRTVPELAQQGFLGRRQLGTVISTREQVAVAVQGVPVLSTRAGRVKFKQAVSTDQKWFYNREGPCTEMRAFSGLRWKTHVLDGASKIAEIRNCSESGSLPQSGGT